jgi:hypothetical protein
MAEKLVTCLLMSFKSFEKTYKCVSCQNQDVWDPYAVWST